VPDWLAKNRDSFAILRVFKALQAGKFRCRSQRRSRDLRDWRLAIGPNDDFAHRLASDASSRRRMRATAPPRCRDLFAVVFGHAPAPRSAK